MSTQARAAMSRRVREPKGFRTEAASQIALHFTPRHARKQLQKPGLGRVAVALGTSFFFTIPGGGTNLSQGISNHWASEPKLSMEDAMKVPVVLLSLVLAGSLFSAVRTGAQDAAETKAAAKEKKWQGHVIRIDKEHSMIDIRGGSAPSTDPRKVAYDTSTEW